LKTETPKNHIWEMDKNGNKVLVDSKDYRWKTGELSGIHTGMIKVIKNNTVKLIKKEELESYISNGWDKLTKENNIIPVPSTSGLIRIHKYDENGIIKRTLISPDKFEDYKQNGWLRGQGKTKPKRKSSKPRKPTIQKGTKTVVSLPDGSKRKFIRKEELEDYISKGWIKGYPRDKNPSTGKIHIHLKNSESNSIEHKMIFKEEFEKYKNLGWKLGIGKRT
jgi:hypothetical protein